MATITWRMSESTYVEHFVPAMQEIYSAYQRRDWEAYHEWCEVVRSLPGFPHDNDPDEDQIRVEFVSGSTLVEVKKGDTLN